ncbi:MAG: rod shape-determining protein MreC [Pyrinomonadaceae bacterium]
MMRTQKEIRQRAPLFLLGLLAGNFALMSLSARDETTHQMKLVSWAQAVASPFQSAVSGAGGAGVGLFQSVANLRRASAENEELKKRLAALEAEAQSSRAAQAESERLRGLLGLKEEGRYETLTARVVARDPSAWFDTLIINQGSAAGIKLNMAVVTGEGLVGRVIGVSPWSAQVALLTDERTAAGAVVGQLETSQAFGVVRGSGESGLLEMRYVPGLEPVTQGEAVLTTGQDGIYPPGLKIGQIVEYKPGTATISHEIKVRPAARLNSLREVSVLLYQSPPHEAPQQTLQKK